MEELHPSFQTLVGYDLMNILFGTCHIISSVLMLILFYFKLIERCTGQKTKSKRDACVPRKLLRFLRTSDVWLYDTLEW